MTFENSWGGVLDRLVDAGNSVTVIEHNLDVIKTAIGLSTWDPTAAPKADLSSLRARRNRLRRSRPPRPVAT